MHPLILSLALASFSPSALFDDHFRPDPWLLPYPSSVTSGEATQVLVGQFSDDKVSDAVELIGGDLYLLYSPDRISSYSKMPGPFDSITKVPLGASPGQEGVIASSSAGLVLLKWGSHENPLGSTLLPGTSGWAGMRQLQTISWPATHQTLICALDPTGSKAYYAPWDGSQVDTTSGDYVELRTSALTIAALDWNGDDVPDFGFDDGGGVFVALGGGGLVDFGLSNPCAAPQVMRLSRLDGLAGPDDLVWFTANPYGSGEMLTVVHSDTNTAETPVFGGSITAAHLTLADLDGDGDQDLAISRSDSPETLVLFRQHTGSMSFGLISDVTGGPLWFDLSYVSGTSCAFPAVGAGDLDGDGDDDLLYAGQPGCANQSMLCFGTGIDEEARDPLHADLIVKPWVGYAHFYNWAYPGSPGPGQVDEAHLELSFWGVGLGDVVSSATHRRVTVWGRMTATGPITPVFLQDKFYAIGVNGPNVPIPLPPNPSSGMPQYLVIQVSYVVCNGTPAAGSVVQAFPAWTGQFNRGTFVSTPPSAGGGTTGGIDRPPPPPSGTPPTP